MPYMFRRCLELAVTKAGSDARRNALLPIVPIAAELDGQEWSFEARINAAKAARGEGPTKLSKKKREEIDQYALDAKEIEEAQIKEFSAADDPWLIVFALHMALENDIGFWSKSFPKENPEESAIVQAFLQAKTRLRDALASYLEQFPDQSDEG